jgi:hypothetical protein
MDNKKKKTTEDWIIELIRATDKAKLEYLESKSSSVRVHSELSA